MEFSETSCLIQHSDNILFICFTDKTFYRKWTDFQSTAIWLGILMGILGLADCSQDLCQISILMPETTLGQQDNRSSGCSEQVRTTQPAHSSSSTRQPGPPSQDLTRALNEPESDNNRRMFLHHELLQTGKDICTCSQGKESFVQGVK